MNIEGLYNFQFFFLHCKHLFKGNAYFKIIFLKSLTTIIVTHLKILCGFEMCFSSNVSLLDMNFPELCILKYMVGVFPY